MSDTLVLIGGLDPTGGAGLLRDAWTIAALGLYAEVQAIVSALTRQGRGRPAEAFPVAPERLRGELDRLHDVAVVKLGMIASAQVGVLAEALDRLRGEGAKIVLDPVWRASDGGWIGARPAELLGLARHVDLITPNRDELAALRALGPIPCASLSKGEPVGAERIRDRLILPEGREWIFERDRVPGPDPRGTGCALASAIACELARGCALELACARAIEWLDRARLQTIRGLDERRHLASA
ncbi:bifunctional hydroxymethylpyrimidine kinase/phosphomethylpyrimidine kinase [Nannocystaceae bacterium ST9]